MDSINHPIEIQYIKRLRRTTIRVRADGSVKVTAPYGLAEKEIYKFVQTKSNWILKKVELFQKIEKQHKYNFKNGEILPFLNEKLQLVIVEGDEGVECIENRLIVSVPVENTKKDFVKTALIEWYQQQAFIKIKEHVMDYSALLGLVPKTISIKNYRSRWGACTSKGDLIFNWQIITLNENHFNYVVAHEICHLKEMNHSPRFYNLLSKLGFEKNSIHAEMRHLRNLF